MRAFIVLSTLAILSGCHCGPGVACKQDTDCASGTRCETLGGSSGFCALIPTADSGSTDAGELDAGTMDAGTPLAMISNAALEFGQVGCGKAPVTKDVMITNAGTAPFTFNATLSGAASFTMGASTGSVAPGTTSIIAVSATALASATAGTDQSGVLTVTTSDPALAKVEIALKMTASGVTLALTPGIASFGLVPVNTTAPAVPLTLTNQGNVAATITVVQPSDVQFSLAWTGMPAAITVTPGGTAAGFAGGFKPTKTTPSSGSAMLSVAEAVCGNSLSSVPFTGTGTSGSVGISTSDVFFGNNGRVSCGTTAPSKTFILNNTGNQAFSWTGTLGKGTSSPFTFLPTSGTVPASTGTVTITVTALPIPAQATTAEEAFGDTLSIVTDAANDSAHPIVLHQTASGAVLAFAPSAIDFGMVPINNTANAPLSVVNDGNAPASVTLASSNASFSVAPTGSVSVGGTSFGAFTGTFAPGSSTVQQSSDISLAVDGGDVLCAPLPLPMTMTGIGTNGSVSYTPVALDFGSVNCGSTAAAKIVTFSNNGNQNYTIVPSLGKGTSSAFTVAMTPDSGIVAQDGGTVVITVTPKPIPSTSAVTPNLYGDTLTVTSDVSGDSPHTIALRETARGSIFAISSNTLSFGTVALGVTASSGFTLSNSGNAQGALRFMNVQPAIFSVPSNVVLSAAASSIENATFTPVAAVSYSDMAAISVSPTTVLCQPLPFPQLMLSGMGSASNVVMVSSSSITFGSGGLVPCGTTAAPKSFNVTNNSTQTLTLALTLAGAAASPYTVSGPVTLAAMTSGMVTVTPKAIPATSSTAPDGFADSLSVKATGGPVNETHIVALHQTAQGAILTFNPTALSFKATLGASDSQNYTINNTGNLAAPVTIAIGGTNPGNYASNPTAATVAAGGNVQGSVTYTSPVLGGTSATMSLTTTAGRCAPLPAAVPLTGSP